MFFYFFFSSKPILSTFFRPSIDSLFFTLLFYSSIGCRLRKTGSDDASRGRLYIYVSGSRAQNRVHASSFLIFSPLFILSVDDLVIFGFFIPFPPAGCCSIFFFFCSYTLISCQFLLDFIFYLFCSLIELASTSVDLPRSIDGFVKMQSRVMNQR